MSRESYSRAVRGGGARPPVPLFAVPWLALNAEGLRLLPLDARTAYVLSLVDGRCDVETILDLPGRELARDDALDILGYLLELGAIELRSRSADDVA
jgi:hypothetical protein